MFNHATLVSMPYLDTIIVDLVNEIALLHIAQAGAATVDSYRHELDDLIHKKNLYDKHFNATHAIGVA